IIIVYVLFSILLSAIQFVPFAELILNGNRSNHSYTFATSGSLGFTDFVTFVFPTFYGNLGDGNWWGKQQMLLGYIGITPLVLLLLFGMKILFHGKMLLLILILFLFIIALGNNTPFYYLLYFLIPGFSFFREPQQILIFYP